MPIPQPSSRWNRAQAAHRTLVHPPSFKFWKLPWIRPAMTGTAMDYCLTARPSRYCSSGGCVPHERNKKRTGSPFGDPLTLSVLLLPRLFSASLASQRFFHTFLFTRFQIKRVPFDFLDDVFLLHLAFEPAQRVFEGFSLLQSYFRQRNNTPKLALSGPDIYCKVQHTKSRGMYDLGTCGALGSPSAARCSFSQKLVRTANCNCRGGYEPVACTGLEGTR